MSLLVASIRQPLKPVRHISITSAHGIGKRRVFLAQADAEALIRDHGAEAYSEARRRERDVILPDGTTHAGRTPVHWRRVALTVARMTGKRVGLDTSTRMAADADPSSRPSNPKGPIKMQCNWRDREQKKMYLIELLKLNNCKVI